MPTVMDQRFPIPDDKQSGPLHKIRFQNNIRVKKLVEEARDAEAGKANEN